MKLSFIEKIAMIFKYIFSSFLSISLFILCLLLFLLLIFNMKKNNKYATYIIIVFYTAIFLAVIIASPSYFVYSIDYIIKGIMKYIYFPSTAAYFMINLASILIVTYSIKSNKITKAKRIFNYVIFSILFYMFISFVVLVAYNKLDIRLLEELYKNDTVLSIVQVSNLVFFVWIIVTLFIKLFKFYKDRFDKKNEDN